MSHIFTEGNVIRGKRTGTVYTVAKSDIALGFAFVEDADGNARAVDWMWGSGVENTEMLNSFELVKEA